MIRKIPSSKEIKLSWDSYHSFNDFELLYPEPILIGYFKYIFNSTNALDKMLDLGCGSGQIYSLCKEYFNLILGVDYSPNAIKRCQEKCSNFKGLELDLTVEKEYRKILDRYNFKNSVITGFQILDHIPKVFTLNLINYIAKCEAKYIIISLFTESCLGNSIRGEFDEKNNTYFSPISINKEDLFEIHSFYSLSEIQLIIDIFKKSNYQLKKSSQSTIKYIDPNSIQKDKIDTFEQMETIYLLFAYD